MLSRHTLSDLVSRVRADLLSRLNVSDVLRRADFEAVSYTHLTLPTKRIV